MGRLSGSKREKRSSTLKVKLSPNDTQARKLKMAWPCAFPKWRSRLAGAFASLPCPRPVWLKDVERGTSTAQVPVPKWCRSGFHMDMHHFYPIQPFLSTRDPPQATFSAMRSDCNCNDIRYSTVLNSQCYPPHHSLCALHPPSATETGRRAYVRIHPAERFRPRRILLRLLLSLTPDFVSQAGRESGVGLSNPARRPNSVSNNSLSLLAALPSSFPSYLIPSKDGHSFLSLSLRFIPTTWAYLTSAHSHIANYRG